MGRTKEMWMADYERLGEEYATSQIEEDEFRARMKGLGFEPGEIDDHLDALADDRASGT